MLTNDSLYWKPPRKIDSIDRSFKIHDNQILSGQLGWSEKASMGSMKDRESIITLSQSYQIKWESYSKLPDSPNNEFRILVVESMNHTD